MALFNNPKVKEQIALDVDILGKTCIGLLYVSMCIKSNIDTRQINIASMFYSAIKKKKVRG